MNVISVIFFVEIARNARQRYCLQRENDGHEEIRKSRDDTFCCNFGKTPTKTFEKKISRRTEKIKFHDNKFVSCIQISNGYFFEKE
jgi:hypothetical protein